MKNKKRIGILVGIVLCIGIGFGIGLWIGRQNVVNNDLAFSRIYGQTFYATIESVKQYNDGRFHINVKGLEVNDINYRGNFTFAVTDTIEMTWQGEKIGISDLQEGDILSITFTDEILNDISPTPLNEVVKVQLLNEKR